MVIIVSNLQRLCQITMGIYILFYYYQADTVLSDPRAPRNLLLIMYMQDEPCQYEEIIGQPVQVFHDQQVDLFTFI